MQGYRPFDAGLLLGAQGLGSALVMPVSGILTDRVAARPPAAASPGPEGGGATVGQAPVQVGVEVLNRPPTG